MRINTVHRDAWLNKHPYLQPLAFLHEQVNAEVDRFQIATPSVPDWNNYISDFHTGLPLLHSPAAAIDLTPAEPILSSLVARVVANRVPETLAKDCRTLHAELGRERDAPRHAIGYLLGREFFASTCPGLLHYLGWTALAHYLRPVVDAFASWRREEQWLRNYCPTCGSTPAMAHLVSTEAGRRRFLLCSRCRTRWQFRRAGCPFCETKNDHQFLVLAVEGQGGLRIDYCESCRAYLKTYNGEGNEGIMLADWTSIHLDLAAQDRGLKRLATSLYEL